MSAVEKPAARPYNPNGPGNVWLWLPPILVFAAVIGLWYLGNASLGQKSLFLPRPDQIVDVFLRADTRGDILSALWVTTQTTIVGLILAALIGIVWAVLMVQAKWIERSTYPYAVLLQSIPILAITPLITVAVDDAFWARAVVCVLIALFPMVSNTFFGLQSVDKSMRELFKLQGASRWIVLSKLQLPAASPAIFAGLRISAGLSVVGAIVGDFFFQQGVLGIGALIRKYQSRLQTPEEFAAIIVASLLGVVVFLIFGLVARLAVGKWYEFG